MFCAWQFSDRRKFIDFITALAQLSKVPHNRNDDDDNEEEEEDVYFRTLSERQVIQCHCVCNIINVNAVELVSERVDGCLLLPKME